MYKNKIGLIHFFLSALTLLSICPVGCLSVAFQLGQSHSYVMKKVWYHEIQVQNNLGFMVLTLLYILEFWLHYP